MRYQDLLICSKCLQIGGGVEARVASRGFEETVLYSKTMARTPERDIRVTASSPFVEHKEEEDYEEEEEEEYLDETQVYLRSKFYESWLWMDVNLPSQVDKDG